MPVSGMMNSEHDKPIIETKVNPEMKRLEDTVGVKYPVFQHDLAPYQASKAVKTFMWENGIICLKWSETLLILIQLKIFGRFTKKG